MCNTIEKLVNTSDVVVITHGGKVFIRATEMMNADQVLIDLVGMGKNRPQLQAGYEGIGW